MSRITMFLLGCVPFRLYMVYIAKILDKRYLPYYGMLALIPFFGFTYIYLNDLRKTGMETNGAPIWRNNLRPIHAALYYLFAIMAIKGKKHAYLALLMDVLIGFIMFIMQHMSEETYTKST